MKKLKESENTAKYRELLHEMENAVDLMMHERCDMNEYAAWQYVRDGSVRYSSQYPER